MDNCVKLVNTTGTEFEKILQHIFELSGQVALLPSQSKK